MNDVILLVEDNSDDEALAIRALQKSNVANRIVVAHDGVEALELLCGENGRERVVPALILMDLKLPRMNGLEALQRIRANEATAHIPVVMLTTSDEEADVMRAYKSGVNSYVRKPIEFTEFSKVTAELGTYWLLINRRPVASAAPKG
jgi:CheY-like chemotaxis protein